MENFSTLLSLATQSTIIISSCVLRLTVPYFVRWLPLGYRFLPIINTSAIIYFSALILRVLGRRKNATGKSKSPLVTLLLGRYEPRTPVATSLAVLTNILCLGASVDFVYRGQVLYQSEDLAFSRVGYVDGANARIVARSPSAQWVQIGYKQEATSVWQVGEVVSVDKASDYVGSFLIEGLVEGTLYEYRTNASHSGRFQTQSSTAEKWSMISSSCLSPFFPYNPLDHPLRIPGFEHLSKFISDHKTEFMLFLGDFIYIDLPFRFGFDTSDYRTAYRKIYASPSWTDDLKALPWLHTYDDHEILNDWASNDTGLYQDAIRPWVNYQQSGNPDAFRQGASYYSFKKGEVSFFVFDTRKYRSEEALEDGPSKTMLGPQQLADVLSWLETEKGLKVFVSSVPFTKNWRGPESIDSWAGYLHERQVILEAMWKTEGVLIISGDRHEHATTKFPSPDGDSNVVEFSTSPLSQFYHPFERQYRQEEETDIMIKVHPAGFSKFGVFGFDTSDPTKWKVDFELIVDGVKEWEYVWTAKRRL